MTPAEFLDAIVPAARASHRLTGIPASFTLAQAALESGWGASKLSRDGCNLFGVKADKAWKGPVLLMQTREVRGGKSVMEMARWRKYATWADCLADRVEFFKRNPRYKACFKETTGDGWCRAVAAAGYATDPHYADKLLAMIMGRNLTRFDAMDVQP
jgi:flagellum-specific peptidoglycan hydrolase FlgJ